MVSAPNFVDRRAHIVVDAAARYVAKDTESMIVGTRKAGCS